MNNHHDDNNDNNNGNNDIALNPAEERPVGEEVQVLPGPAQHGEAMPGQAQQGDAII